MRPARGWASESHPEFGGGRAARFGLAGPRRLARAARPRQGGSGVVRPLWLEGRRRRRPGGFIRPPIRVKKPGSGHLLLDSSPIQNRGISKILELTGSDGNRNYKLKPKATSGMRMTKAFQLLRGNCLGGGRTESISPLLPGLRAGALAKGCPLRWHYVQKTARAAHIQGLFQARINTAAGSGQSFRSLRPAVPLCCLCD